MSIATSGVAATSGSYQGKKCRSPRQTVWGTGTDVADNPDIGFYDGDNGDSDGAIWVVMTTMLMVRAVQFLYKTGLRKVFQHCDG